MSAEPRRLRAEVLGDASLSRELPTSGILVVGSSPERAQLVIPGQGVDDAHCAIGAVKGGGFAVKDLGSRFGTILNGTKVAAARVGPGDVLVLGSRRIRLVDPDAPAAVEEEPAAPQGAPSSSPSAGTPLPTSAGPPGSAGGGPPVPRRIGGYRVERLLGRGGMGTVLLAVQESLSRPVALKVLAPRLAADADFVRRFQSEARAAARLSHPNVVVVHDVGEADGCHFLSMEYMARGSLEERVARDGPLPWRQVLDVLHDAARGLVYAEEKGIVHRDIKPANLMQDAAGTTKIADLGLATTIEAEASNGGEGAGAEGRKVFGTPHFVAPEQARGEAVDHRADLYSLGATAYRLLTGRTPFEGETTRDILRGHLTQEPAAPRTHVPELPEALDALVLRLLAKDPAARVPSAAELLREVDRLRLEADHGVPSAERRRPVGLWIAAAVVLVAGAAAALVAPRLLGGRAEPGAAGATAVGTASASEVEEDPTRFAPPAVEEGAGAALEQELALANLAAENALLKLPADLPLAERAQRLRDIAAAHPGTDAAARVEAEAAEIDRELARRAAARERSAATVAATTAELRRRAGLDGPELLPLGEALAALGAYAPAAPPEDAALAAELAPALEEARAAVARELLAAHAAEAAAALARAEGAAAEGRFDEAERELAGALARLDLASLDEAARPADEELGALRTRAAERLAGLDAERAAWVRTRVLEDRGAIAAALTGGGAGGGLAADLRRLDLEAARARLEALAARLVTDEARAFAAELAADVAAARGALDALVAEHARGGWRRTSVLDPRGGVAEAVGATAQGLVLASGGASELVPWSTFGGDARRIQELFDKRLSRDWTAAEAEGVAALLRLTAAVQAADVAREALRPSGVRLGERRREELLAPFAPGIEWVEAGRGAAERAELEAERDAARLLVDALAHAEAERWAAAAAGLERLLADYRDALVVRLLSDGSGVTEVAELAPPPAHAALPRFASRVGTAEARAADDAGAPEGATNDKSAPEGATNDTGAPDGATDDTGAPGGATNDTGAPEGATDGAAAPDGAPDGAGASGGAPDPGGAGGADGGGR